MTTSRADCSGRAHARFLVGAAAPRHARPFVALFLAVLAVCAVASFNPWPFSNWELFSRLRTDQQIGWEPVAVDSAGGVHDYPIASRPHGYRGFGSAVIADFLHGSAAGRDAICAAWLRGATEQVGPGTRLLRIYRLVWLLSARQGDRAAPAHRTLVWICSTKGARAAG